MTHRDPKAYFAALAVAIAASDTGANVTTDTDSPAYGDWRQTFLRSLDQLMDEASSMEFRALAKQARDSAVNGEPVSQFAESIGSKRGISGYAYHTVPCVLQVWFRFGDDFAHGLEEIIRAGGDTDTAGAIYGAIVGARAGKAAIPQAWLDGIIDWPRSVAWLERLGGALAQRTESDSSRAKPPAYFSPAIIPRNLVFLAIVLAHGFRRLLPPY